MFPTRSVWASLGVTAAFGVLLVERPAAADAGRAAPHESSAATAPSTSTASPSAAPQGATDVMDVIDVTILRTVNLPWQEPEVIVTPKQDVTDLRVELTIDGVAGPTRELEVLAAGAPRSFTWTAQAGLSRCTVRVTGVAPAGEFEQVASAEVAVTAPLEVTLQPSDVDLRARQLSFAANASVAFAELSIHDMDGRLLHRDSTRFTSATRKPGMRTLSWPALSAPAARLALRVFSTSDTWADAVWTPIQIEIPHEPIFFTDVVAQAPSAGGNFAGGKFADAYDAVVRALRDHEQVRGLRLYVLGHSGNGHDAAYAQQRTQSVAAYFRDRGLVLPIYAGTAIDPESTHVVGAGEVQAFLALAEPAAAQWTALRGARPRATQPGAQR